MAGKRHAPCEPREHRRRRATLAGAVAAAALLGAPLLAQPLAPGGTFAGSDRCMTCHNRLRAPSGEEVSIGPDWRGSMMANAARDPYWQASVRRETLDHPTAVALIEHECATCHMPMAHFPARAAGGLGEIFAHLPVGVAGTPAALLAGDGVSCTVCHQIATTGLGAEASFTGHFAIAGTLASGERVSYGRFSPAEGQRQIMASASGFAPVQGEHLGSSEVCATCHTLYTHALGADGEVVGRLPEQVPYLEWRHSAYAPEQGCVACHMPRIEGTMAIASVMGTPRDGLTRHLFRGGNFLVPLMLDRFRDDLGVVAPSHELKSTSQRTRAHLTTAAARVAIARLELRGGELLAEVAVENLAGHKLPTAYPSRRAWLQLTVHDGNGQPLFESGALAPDGAIAGNANDLDPARYEPHYREITDSAQVQIYEPILAGPDGAVTTGLLTANAYAKDNRLLPKGFDKASAPADVAVRGGAAADPDFVGGGDRVRYRVPVAGAAGPWRVEARLWYQPIGFRWAENLRPRPSAEGERFLAQWQALAADSAVELARAEASLPAAP